jgi:chemosensory pili system protein ChpA (sensor histidine kinase/response regulator)
MSAVLDIGPLTWVKGEIDSSLERARAALRAYGANLANAAHLKSCRSHLHQASGAVQIVGLEGVSRFFEQTESLLSDVESGSVESERGVLELLERAIGAIGKYLAELIDGEPDQPLRLYPEYRLLAEARKAPSPAEAELFFPDLTLSPPRRDKPAVRLQHDELEAFVREQRTRFQRGFVKWLREPSDIAAISEMRAAVDEVESTQTIGVQRSLWWLAGAFFDALACGDLAVEAGVKQLTGRIEQQLRRMSSEPAEAPDRLLREVLYWLAHAGVGSARVRAAKEAFKLEDALPATQKTPESPQRAAAALALREAITGAKEAWTRYAAGAEGAHAAFAQHASAIATQARRLGDAELTKLGDAIGRIGSGLGAEPADVSEAAAMEVATALLVLENAASHYEHALPDLGRQVEVVLERLGAVVFGEPAKGPLPTTGLVDEMTRRAQERLAMGTALIEILANLKHIEQVLDAYFRDPAKVDQLAGVDPVIHRVSGALRVLGEEQAREALVRCAAKIRGFSMTGVRPEMEEFEEVAQILSGLSFYLEALRHGKADFAAAMRPINEPPGAGGEGEQPDSEDSGDEAGAPEAPQSGREQGREVGAREAPAPASRAEAPAPVAVAGPESIDQELLVIFLEEAHTVLATLTENLEVCRTQPASTPHLTTIRRAFHTLKGSGRMVGLMRLGEAAWAVEQVMNLWLQEERGATPELLELIEQARRLFADWVRRLEANETQPDPDPLIVFAEQVKRGERLPAAPSPVVEAPPDVVVQAVPEEPEPEFSDETAVQAEEAEAATVSVGDVTVSASLFAVFVREASQFLETLERELAAAAASGKTSEELVRAAHTFGGICGTVQITPMRDLGHALEAALLRLRRRDAPPQATELRRLAYCIGALRVMYTEVCARRLPRARDELVAALGTMGTELEPPKVAERDAAPEVEVVPDATSGMAEESAGAQDLSFSIEDLESVAGGSPQELSRSDAAPTDTMAADEAAGNAPRPGAEAADLVFSLDAIEPEESQAAQGDAERTPIVDTSLEELTLSLEGLELGTELSAGAGEDMPKALFDSGEEGVTPPDRERPSTEAGALEELVFSLDGLDGVAPQPRETQESATAEANGGPAADGVRPLQPPESAAEPEAAVERRQRRIEDDIDPQLLPVFLEEAQELSPQIGEMLRAWRREPNNWDLAGGLQRALHTFKGGARMAGAMSVGELTHHMETRVESAVALKSSPPQFFDDLEASFDRVGLLLERLQRPVGAPPDAGTPVPGAPDAAPESAPDVAPVREVLPARALLRVQADTLEKLVNRAGEVAIARSRIETEVRVLKSALSDLTDNVARLRGQLREIEIQAESQMQARVREVEEASRTFDPLEFDRFTRFQELTRMMAESVNDVSTLYQNITRAVDGTDAALSAQARLNRELQQDLMRVRMVPVGSISDRLHRTVRQTAKEIEKRANLDIRGGSVELDRSVLERMTGPFEHVLRNAITHGIESPAERLERGKPEFGEIKLDARQEGNEVVLTISDDGGGLNLERIRAQAIERGLMVPGESMEEGHLGDLIFLPGFSTAAEVTQVAGRGVGMDVVREEVRALGGRIEVESLPGKGVTFTIRLPLTTAVTQTVLVKSGARTCALPAVMVEQVRRFRPGELDALRAQGRIDWAGRNYPFAYLPDLLGEPGVPSDEAKRRAPVLLARLGAETIALLVDDVVGNQEVVVKNLGPQLARVPGVSGATVLGTGEIVLILNPIPLLRLPRVQGQATAAIPEAPQAAKEKVIVVDDSLTVRKITGRLLAREGYDVLTAKDGVEALELLEDVVPDAMLVDIEMPRMDGFDLTRNVRADPRLKHVPIIMITSRTAEKHRAYAQEVGVDEFLGKPYREDELLGHVSRLIGRHASAN